MLRREVPQDQLNFQHTLNDLTEQRDPTSNILNNDNQEASERAVRRQTKGKQVARIKPNRGQARHACGALLANFHPSRDSRGSPQWPRVMRERGTFYVRAKHGNETARFTVSRSVFR